MYLVCTWTLTHASVHVHVHVHFPCTQLSYVTLLGLCNTQTNVTIQCHVHVRGQSSKKYFYSRFYIWRRYVVHMMSAYIQWWNMLYVQFCLFVCFKFWQTNLCRFQPGITENESTKLRGSSLTAYHHVYRTWEAIWCSFCSVSSVETKVERLTA